MSLLTKVVLGNIGEKVIDVVRGKGGANKDAHRALSKGDVVGVSRGVYDHYGVFINDDQVISYTSKGSDVGSDNFIQSNSLATFLRGSDSYFILNFPTAHGTPEKIKKVVSCATVSGGMPDLSWFRKIKNYKLYSPTETVKRAESRLGEQTYSLTFNNCEHFAIWCKTGISESHQVKKVISYLTSIPVKS